jgi:hypothetical protein
MSAGWLSRATRASHPPQPTPGCSDAIHKENLETLARLTPDEIAAEREALLKVLDPALVRRMRQSKAEKAARASASPAEEPPSQPPGEKGAGAGPSSVPATPEPAEGPGAGAAAGKSSLEAAIESDDEDYFAPGMHAYAWDAVQRC